VMRSVFLSLVFLVFGAGAVFSFEPRRQMKNLPLRAPAVKEEALLEEGWRIAYAINFGSISVGEAVCERMPKVQYRKKETHAISFVTRLSRLTDRELIYFDPRTFLPLRVERHIATWPTPEHIIEEYDQENFLLIVKKTKGKAKTELTINKDGVIHNVILLPFCLRDTKALREEGNSFIARLPTQEFQIIFLGQEKIRVPAGEFLSYHFASKPRKFEFWISADEQGIPLRIQGLSRAGYVLLMKEYTKL
jgi:hypothetical protein